MAYKELSKEHKELIGKIESSFKGEVKTGEIKKTGFSASSLFYATSPGNCPRRWSLVFQGVAESHDEWEYFNRRAVHAGSSAHDQLQEMIREENPGVVIEEEFKITNPTMRGFIDAYFPDENIPLEIKTCNARSFEIRKEKMEATEYQLRQLLVYMKVKKAKLGLMLYECRDTFEIIIIPVVMTPEREAYIDKVFDWMREVEKAKNDGELIKVFAGRRSNSRICASCPIKKACDEAPEGTVDIPLLSKYTEEEM